MNYKEGLKHKAECILAFLNGETIESLRDAVWGVDEMPHFRMHPSRYRIAKKPEPRLPDAPIWWVKFDTRMVLVTYLYEDTFSWGDTSKYFNAKQASINGWQWSTDRQNWHNF